MQEITQIKITLSEGNENNFQGITLGTNHKISNLWGLMI